MDQQSMIMLVHCVTMDCCVKFLFAFLVFGQCVFIVVVHVVEMSYFPHELTISFFFSFSIQFRLTHNFRILLIHSLIQYSIWLIVVIDGYGNFYWDTSFSCTNRTVSHSVINCEPPFAGFLLFY